MTLHNIIAFIGIGAFASIIALIIIDIIFDEIRRRKQIKEAKRQRTLPIEHDCATHHHIIVKYNPPLEKSTVTITRRGKKIEITEAEHEEIKRQNREKMRAYRASKRAKLTRTAKKSK